MFFFSVSSKILYKVFFTKLFKLDPDPQKMNADPQPW